MKPEGKTAPTLQTSENYIAKTSIEEQICTQSIGSIARLVHLVSGDLDAFGPYVHQRVLDKAGRGIAVRLQMILKELEELAFDLYAQRREYLETQLRVLEIEERQAPLNLHIGCGDYLLDSWVNIDFHPAQLSMDLRWGLPFQDASAAFVFLSHTLEHFYYPQEALRITNDIRRVLQPGGILRVVVPDIEKCLRAYVENDGEFFANRRKTWTWWPECVTKLTDFLSYAGAGSWCEFRSHKFGYDYDTLRHLLVVSGFRTVQRSEYMESAHQVLRVDHASLVAGASYGDEHYSLFVEATA